MNLIRHEKNRTKINDYILRIFPYIKFWDIGKHEVENQKVSVANIQIESPDSFFVTTETDPHRLTPEAEYKQKQKIDHFVKEAVERGADLIVLPELSTSENICKEMKEKLSNFQSIIVMGSYYDNYSQNRSPILIDGNRYDQVKNNPSPEEKGYMRRSSDVNVFINTPIGDFAVLICYDATDFSILSALQDSTDFLICIARTKDIRTFRNIFRGFTYLQYQYVIFCNDAQYGGSSFFLPFHGNRALDVLGQKNESILYRTFDLKKLDEMRAVPIKDDKLFKYPPASSKPRHIPHVKGDHRRKEFFEARSFNFLSDIRNLDILNRFLAHVNVSHTLTIGVGSSIHRIIDVLVRSCQTLYAPAMPLGNIELKRIVCKYFLVYLLDLLCQDDKTILEEKNTTEIIKRFSKIKDKQYILFEIDQDIIQKALLDTPELLDELLRVYDIEIKDV